MTTLKSTTETVIRVDYYDLDSFIREITGQKGYSCVADEEWGNDSEHRLKVDCDMVEYDLKNWEAFKIGACNKYYMLRTILNGLCFDGHIPAGTYLIRVCW